VGTLRENKPAGSTNSFISNGVGAGAASTTDATTSSAPAATGEDISALLVAVTIIPWSQFLLDEFADPVVKYDAGHKSSLLAMAMLVTAPAGVVLRPLSNWGEKAHADVCATNTNTSRVEHRRIVSFTIINVLR